MPETPNEKVRQLVSLAQRLVEGAQRAKAADDENPQDYWYECVTAILNMLEKELSK